jgi:hypothetical protein
MIHPLGSGRIVRRFRRKVGIEVIGQPRHRLRLDVHRTDVVGRLDDPLGAIPDVVVDFRAVTYLNSTNIAQLLRLRKKLLTENERKRESRKAADG